MKYAHWPSMFGAALLLAGCAAREDVIRESGIGYIENSTQVVAAADWSRAETVTVTLSEFSFSPANLTFATGSPYRLLIRNIGNIQHLFVADGFFKGIAAQRLKTPDGDVDAPHLAAIAVPPGAEKELAFVAVTPGTYHLECSLPFHATFGMEGEIAIR